jgi:tetratricopeptide (TPR) repeat protein
MIKTILILLFLILAPVVFSKSTSLHSAHEDKLRLLEKAKLETNRGAYDEALKLLIEYRKASVQNKKDPLISFYVIESIGRIYLRVKQDPDAAIKFFSEALNDPNLPEVKFDIIRSWLGRSKEWKELNVFPKNIKDPNKLFELGKKYYEQGIKSQKYTMDLSASADFSLAANYLVPFTIHYDKDSRLGEALYMMGEIRRRSWHDNGYWSENFYLMEVIRRYPNSDLAAKAYLALDEDVHFGYTGSSGDHTPESWLELLKEFELLSRVNATNIPTIRKLD